MLALPQIESARSVALYSAIGSEVRTDAVAAALAARGVEVGFPRVEGEEIELYRVRSLAELSPGFRGILEPPGGAPLLDPGAIDVCLVPGLLFDRVGTRLGRGAGHYDRLLPRLSRAYSVGLCYADRVVERLPRAPWDRRVDCIVTDDAVIPSGGPGD